MLPDRLSISVAISNLVESKRLTGLTIGVVSISVVLVVFLTSLISGLQKSLVEEVTGSIPHIVVEPKERQPVAAWEARPRDENRLFVGERSGVTRQKRKIENWRELLPTIERLDRRVSNVVASVEERGFAIRGQTREAVRISGVQPRQYDAIVDLQSSLLRGRFYELAPGEVAIGYTLAETLAVGLGDRIQVAPPTGEAVSKTVAGLYDTGVGQLDEATVFMLLNDGQSLFGLGSAINSVGMTVQPVFDADEVADRLALHVPQTVTSWTEQNERLLRALEAQSTSSTMLVLFATVAAAFAIASILIVLVTNKLPEIGILKTMGATSRQVRATFAVQGALLATFGGIFGSAAGYLFCLALSTVEGPPTETGRVEPLFPFDFSPSIFLGAVVIAGVVGFAASLIPARRAGKVSPIDVIRGM